MTDNEIIKFIEHAINSAKGEDGFKEIYWKKLDYILDLINRQKEEIERLNKDCEDVIYKLEYLLCTATGNKFSKHTYPIGDMVSYVNDYIQDCCNEAVEEAKEAVKSEAIKEFEEELEYFILNEDVEIVKPKCKYYRSYINGANQFRHQIKNGIKKLVKEMEVSK